MCIVPLTVEQPEHRLPIREWQGGRVQWRRTAFPIWQVELLNGLLLHAGHEV